MSEVIEKVMAKRTIVLEEARVGLAEHRRRDWVVDAAEGTSIEDVLEPSYWAYVAGQFNVMDRIDVRLETGDWVAELIVVSCGRNWARVHLAAKHDLIEVTTAPAESIKHKVEYKGPHKKFCVVRLSDSMVIQDGFGTKAEGEVWLANHERVTT